MERVNEELPWDSDYLLLWHGQRWRVATGGFVLWLADVVVGATRDIPNFEQWLNEQEMLGYCNPKKGPAKISTCLKVIKRKT